MPPVPVLTSYVNKISRIILKITYDVQICKFTRQNYRLVSALVSIEEATKAACLIYGGNYVLNTIGSHTHGEIQAETVDKNPSTTGPRQESNRRLYDDGALL